MNQPVTTNGFTCILGQASIPKMAGPAIPSASTPVSASRGRAGGRDFPGLYQRMRYREHAADYHVTPDL